MDVNNREHQRVLEQIMVQMRELFGDHFRLTLLARNASLSAPDKDIMITEDNLDKACDALNCIRMEQLLSPAGIQYNGLTKQ